MLRVPVHAIQPGMVLARPIPLPANPRRYLLPRDREIPMDLVPRLKQIGVGEVWVRHRQLEFLEELIDEGLSEHQRETYFRFRRQFEAVLRDGSMEIDAAGLEAAAGKLFAFLKSSARSCVLVQKLDTFDNYLMSHSTNVCYLGLLLGIKLERYVSDEQPFEQAREAKNLHLLGLGCLLHDIGKVFIPQEIIHKRGKLDACEAAEMQRHTQYGYQLVRRNVPALAAQVVLHHHQRWDGTGYPSRVDSRTGKSLAPLAGRQIPVFARIATVVDVYDAATTRRCYSRAKPPFKVLWEMRHQCRGFFDPVIEAAFYRMAPPFPIGQIVALSDGTEAAVVDFNPDAPARPRVKCLRSPRGEPLPPRDQEELDLSQIFDLEIAWVDGRDVRPYTACQQSTRKISPVRPSVGRGDIPGDPCESAR